MNALLHDPIPQSLPDVIHHPTSPSQTQQHTFMEVTEDGSYQKVIHPFDPNEESIQIPYKFNTRIYQEDIYNAIPFGYKRGVICWHRRAGKDKVFFNILPREAMKRVGTYWYVFPYYKQVREVVWEGMDKTGFRTLDHIPPRLIHRKDNQKMTLTMVHPTKPNAPGSILRFLGSDNIDSSMGAGPIGVLFSEFSLQRPGVWALIAPILRENGGWAFFNGTPRSTNHFYDRCMMAKTNPNWFYDVRTIEDTSDAVYDPDANITEVKDGKRIVTDADVAEELAEGVLKPLIEQEYYCSFQAGNVGSVFADTINHLEEAGRIHRVPHDPKFGVYTVWDLGISKGNNMCVWFFQIIGKVVNMIDYMEEERKPMSFFIKKMSEGRFSYYRYDEHFGPHDIEVADKLTLKTRRQRLMEDYDFQMTTVPKLAKEDQINEFSEVLQQCEFDKEYCKQGIDALKNYRYAYDDVKKVYSNKPVHDWASNPSDSIMLIGVIKSLNMVHIEALKRPGVRRSSGRDRKPKVIRGRR